VNWWNACSVSGGTVDLVATAEVPPCTGGVVSERDLDGTGAFASRSDDFTVGAASVAATFKHTYDVAGTYLVTARANAQREGDATSLAPTFDPPRRSRESASSLPDPPRAQSRMSAPRSISAWLVR
jgi:hypothetical protein